MELIDIEGISDHTRRMQGINFSGGATNAVEFCTNMLGLPTPVEWEEAFLADRAAGLLANGVTDVCLDIPTTPVAFQNATRIRFDHDEEETYEDNGVRSSDYSSRDEEEEEEMEA